jgi:hypothetical protein
MILIVKRRGSPQSLPNRSLFLSVRLGDGLTTFDLNYQETSTLHWRTSGSFQRPPKVLATDLTEFAVSTAASDPFDPNTNPTGVREQGIVRVTLGTSRRIQEKARTRWVHDIKTLSAAPRN